MKRIVGLCAIAALAACNSSNDGGIAGPVENGELFPLGNEVPVTVDVMSADRQNGNTVSVSREEATVTLNSFSLEGEDFDVTLTLPDGSSVNLTETTKTDPLFGPLENLLQGFTLTTDDGDVVQVAIGFDLPTPVTPTVALQEYEPRTAEDVIFIVARANLAEGEGEKDLDGYNTYVAFGDQTETLPTGWATYSGATIATAYQDGVRIDDDFIGTARVAAYFDESTVDIGLTGNASDDLNNYSYLLVGENLPVEGSEYGGALGIAGFGPGRFESEFSITAIQCRIGCNTTIDLAGDVLGAFYGENALATAGVFGATETEQEEVFNKADVEIVGGFAAYADNALPQ